MEKTFLAFARDMGAANMVVPLGVELRKRGHTVFICLDRGGKAVEQYPSFTAVYQPAYFDYLMSQRKVDAILNGLSSPRGELESWLDAQAPLLRDAPLLVQCEDYWGAYTRSKVAPHGLITIDRAARRLARGAGMRGHICTAGFAGISPVKADMAIQLAMRQHRVEVPGVQILVYPDGGPECELALPMLVESILQTRASVTLVPKFHPKFKKVKHPQGGTWDGWCRQQLVPLYEAGRVLHIEGPTDQVVACADGVASGYSTLLMRPATMGKLALTLWDPVIEQQLGRETGLKQTPLMLQHARFPEWERFPVLTHVTPLDPFFETQQPTLVLPAFQPGKAAAFVLSLLT